jgi:hypothetical protein
VFYGNFIVKLSPQPLGRQLLRFEFLEQATDSEVFVYTGAGGEGVPDDVVRVIVDSSVTSIRMKLVEVEISEGLIEIGDDSFRWCENSITKINIPHSGRLTNVHLCPLFDVPFVSTMALKELEEEHFLTAYSPTLGPTPSSP